MAIVPSGFPVPAVHRARGLRLELLGPRHNEADHAAWTSSIEHIRATPGIAEGFNGQWPPATGMTLAENLADLVSHAERSAHGVDLAYTVVDELADEVVGCVYLKPARDPLSVQVLSWVSAARAELDGPLTQIVGDWLLADWPFTTVRYRRGPVSVTLRPA
ncbi:hypothetical protein GCM10022197_34600 [Microlunatus spumicola]|uniref:N-acetyltransferase n=1 Tax=Microlunatus spumicola TaxID=81499 RepID=A0ABP6Y004_9ACTN